MTSYVDIIGDDSYLKNGDKCKCRHCGTVVEIIDDVGLIVDYKPVAIDDDNVHSKMFAVFLIDFEKLEQDID